MNRILQDLLLAIQSAKDSINMEFSLTTPDHDTEQYGLIWYVNGKRLIMEAAKLEELEAFIWGYINGVQQAGEFYEKRSIIKKRT